MIVDGKINTHIDQTRIKAKAAKKNDGDLWESSWKWYNQLYC